MEWWLSAEITVADAAPLRSGRDRQFAKLDEADAVLLDLSFASETPAASLEPRVSGSDRGSDPLRRAKLVGPSGHDYHRAQLAAACSGNPSLDLPQRAVTCGAVVSESGLLVCDDCLPAFERALEEATRTRDLGRKREAPAPDFEPSASSADQRREVLLMRGRRVETVAEHLDLSVEAVGKIRSDAGLTKKMGVPRK